MNRSREPSARASPTRSYCVPNNRSRRQTRCGWHRRGAAMHRKQYSVSRQPAFNANRRRRSCALAQRPQQTRAFLPPATSRSIPSSRPAAPNAMRHMTALAAVRLTGRALLDAVGGRLPGGHYRGVLSGHEQAVEIQLSVLRRHLLDGPQASAARRRRRPRPRSERSVGVASPVKRTYRRALPGAGTGLCRSASAAWRSSSARRRCVFAAR
jgi:hypothetical protein